MLADRLVEVLAPVVASAGYDLEDVVVTPAGKRRMVRVAVDKDGGVTLDECADLSRAVSAALDDADDLLGAAPYTLEVSSPGVSRPLTKPRHWRRSIGRLVKVTSVEGATTIGRVTAASEDGAELDVDGDLRTVAYGDVRKAVVQVELNRRLPDDAAATDDEDEG